MDHPFSLQGPNDQETTALNIPDDSHLSSPASSPSELVFSQQNYKHNLHSTWLIRTKSIDRHDKFGFTSATVSEVASREPSRAPTPAGRRSSVDYSKLPYPGGVSALPWVPKRLRSCENPHLNDKEGIAGCFTCASDLLQADKSNSHRSISDDKPRQGDIIKGVPQHVEGEKRGSVQ
jgi:hypothetical protein